VTARRRRTRGVRRVGLTGGIGTGKSTALAILRRGGAATLDADRLARQVVAPGKKAYRQIVEVFGKAILRSNRTLDRAKLAKIVFANAEQRKRLQRIVHPPVMREIDAFLMSPSGNRPLRVVSIPLLFEAGYARRFDFVVVVKAAREKCVRRLQRTRGMHRRDVLARMKAQWPLKMKCKRADFVLNNNGTQGQLKLAVQGLMRKLRN
jgi:dephospho-CoA kinase